MRMSKTDEPISGMRRGNAGVDSRGGVVGAGRREVAYNVLGRLGPG